MDGRRYRNVVEEGWWARGGRHSKAKGGLPWTIDSIWGPSEVEMAKRIDVADGGGNGLHHQGTMSLHDVDSVNPQVRFADERWGEAEA